MPHAVSANRARLGRGTTRRLTGHPDGTSGFGLLQDVDRIRPAGPGAYVRASCSTTGAMSAMPGSHGGLMQRRIS